MVLTAWMVDLSFTISQLFRKLLCLFSNMSMVTFRDKVCPVRMTCRCKQFIRELVLHSVSATTEPNGVL